jgi:hypothetical protein
MSGMIIALALFGCSDDATLCQRLSDQVQTFESQAQCEAALDAAFETDVVRQANYPTVIGRCMDEGQLARIGDNTVDLSERDIRLVSRDGANGV